MSAMHLVFPTNKRMLRALTCSWTRSILSKGDEKGGSTGRGGSQRERRRERRHAFSSGEESERGSGRESGQERDQVATMGSLSARVLGNATKISPQLSSSTLSPSTASIPSRDSIDSILRQTGQPFLDAVHIDQLDPPRGSKRLNVAVLLSGGVDSSLALYLLHKIAGHNVTAFYLQIWFQEDFRNTWDACRGKKTWSIVKRYAQPSGSRSRRSH